MRILKPPLRALSRAANTRARACVYVREQTAVAHGNDLNEDIGPIEAGLTWTIGKSRREKCDFVGGDVIKQQLADGVTRRRVGLHVGKGGSPFYFNTKKIIKPRLVLFHRSRPIKKARVSPRSSLKVERENVCRVCVNRRRPLGGGAPARGGSKILDMDGGGNVH